MRSNLLNWDKVILVLSVLDILMALYMQSVCKIPYFVTFLRANMVVCIILLVEAISNIRKYKANKDVLAKFM